MDRIRKIKRMKIHYLRLDDAAPKRDVEKWDRIEKLLDKYGIKPLVGIIPLCKDVDFEKYTEDIEFWSKRVPEWQEKQWTLAMHGYKHVFSTNSGGANPVNLKSEYAGLSYEEQKRKIEEGVSVLRNNGIEPKVFFAPAHTFDRNTVRALLEVSDIRVISDTPANKPYCRWGMTFIPQQSGKVRKLPFHTTTYCYHPNSMTDKDFEELEEFIRRNEFADFPIREVKRKISLYDLLLMKAYYMKCMRK